MLLAQIQHAFSLAYLLTCLTERRRTSLQQRGRKPAGSDALPWSAAEPRDIAAELQHAQKAEAEGVAQAQAQADGEAAAQAASEQPEGAAVHTRAQELPQDTSEQVHTTSWQSAALN